MTSETWRKCGAGAAIGAFAMPFVLAFVDRGFIDRGFDRAPLECSLVAATAGVFVALQALAVMRALRPGIAAVRFARRVAAVHASVALIIFLLASGWRLLDHSRLFATWYIGWFGPSLQGGNGDPQSSLGPWVGLTLLPYFVGAQWFCLRLAEDGSDFRAAWRGVAIACIATGALMGIWTFSPALINNHWSFFQDATSTFFNLGVALHFFALWQILARSRFDWAWAGLIGFLCLISGPILMRFAGHGSATTFEFSVGDTLHTGWYALSPYLPPIGYGLTGVAAVVMFRTRMQRSGATTGELQDSRIEVSAGSAVVDSKPREWVERPRGDRASRAVPARPLA